MSDLITETDRMPDACSSKNPQVEKFEDLPLSWGISPFQTSVGSRRPPSFRTPSRTGVRARSAGGLSGHARRPRHTHGLSDSRPPPALLCQGEGSRSERQQQKGWRRRGGDRGGVQGEEGKSCARFLFSVIARTTAERTICMQRTLAAMRSESADVVNSLDLRKAEPHVDNLLA